MFQRKIENELIEWKNSLKIKKTALILKGMRQVGKTFIVKHFAQNNYDNIVYINFKIDTNFKKAFEDDLNVSTIIRNLSIINPAFQFIPYQTVIIFDEIQECSGARASLKPFVLDGKYDIMATGSLLGVKGYNKNYHGGVSVGFEHTIFMKAMDYEEFLWAKGIGEETFEYIKDCFNKKTPLSNVIYETLHKYFKEYICVGGLPSIVDTFVKTNDFRSVRTQQHDILESYKDDFAKHLNEKEEEVLDKTLLSKINMVFNSIPAQLSKENKKFIYSMLENKATSTKFDPAINWLKEYGLVEYCYNLHNLELPFEGNKIENNFKLFFSDTGLFISMFDDDIVNEIFFGNMGIYKGVIYENIVADAFIKNNIPLYYFSKNSGLEIDFITKFEKEITLIEVKATNGNK